MLADDPVLVECYSTQSVLLALGHLKSNRNATFEGTTAENRRIAPYLHIKISMFPPRSSDSFLKVRSHAFKIARVSGLLEQIRDLLLVGDRQPNTSLEGQIRYYNFGASNLILMEYDTRRTLQPG